jgi:hypothetical protein
MEFDLPLSGSMLTRISEELPHDVELVKTRKDLLPLLSARSRIGHLDDLGVVLNDVGKARGTQSFLPEVIGLQARGIGRIARTIAPALVERQKP